MSNLLRPKIKNKNLSRLYKAAMSACNINGADGSHYFIEFKLPKTFLKSSSIFMIGTSEPGRPRSLECFKFVTGRKERDEVLAQVAYPEVCLARARFVVSYLPWDMLDPIDQNTLKSLGYKRKGQIDDDCFLMGETIFPEIRSTEEGFAPRFVSDEEACLLAGCLEASAKVSGQLLANEENIEKMGSPIVTLSKKMKLADLKWTRTDQSEIFSKARDQVFGLRKQKYRELKISF